MTPDGSSGGRRRIAILGPTHPFRGGIAHYTTLLARHLRESHDVALVSFERQYPSWLFPGETDRDPSTRAVTEDAVHVLSPLRPWTWWRTARAVVEHRPELVLVQWWVPFWAPSLAVVARLVRRWSAARVVFVCHNVTPHDAGGPWDAALTRLALSGGDAYVVHSASDERALRALLPEQAAAPGAVVRGILPVHAITDATDPAAARSSLGIAADRRLVLFFGFVRPYKGLDVLVDAMPRVSARVPEVHALVAGEFWRSPGDYLRRARRLGVADRITIREGYVPNEDVGRLFSAAELVVMPYREATQSGVVTLATAFGLPIVGTDVGGLPEVILHERTGLIVPPNDPEALADAIVRCLTDEALYETLRGGVRASAERFSWDRLTDLVATMAAGA